MKLKYQRSPLLSRSVARSCHWQFLASSLESISALHHCSPVITTQMGQKLEVFMKFGFHTPRTHPYYGLEEQSIAGGRPTKVVSQPKEMHAITIFVRPER